MKFNTHTPKFDLAASAVRACNQLCVVHCRVAGVCSYYKGREVWCSVWLGVCQQKKGRKKSTMAANVSVCWRGCSNTVISCCWLMCSRGRPSLFQEQRSHSHHVVVLLLPGE